SIICLGTDAIMSGRYSLDLTIVLRVTASMNTSSCRHVYNCLSLMPIVSATSPRVIPPLPGVDSISIACNCLSLNLRLLIHYHLLLLIILYHAYATMPLIVHIT